MFLSRTTEKDDEQNPGVESGFKYTAVSDFLVEHPVWLCSLTKYKAVSSVKIDSENGNAKERLEERGMWKTVPSTSRVNVAKYVQIILSGEEEV